MPRHKNIRRFSRDADQRKALLKALASSLFLKERIRTTQAKAKETARFAEKLITKAKTKDVNARRYLARFLAPKVVKKLVNDIAPKYQNRPGGYTRIIKLGPRTSNAAKMAFIELLK